MQMRAKTATMSPVRTPITIPAIAPAFKPRLPVDDMLSGLADAEAPVDVGDGDGVVPADVVDNPDATSDVDELPGPRLEVGLDWSAAEVVTAANGESGAAMFTTDSLRPEDLALVSHAQRQALLN
jgi:hypothetical protein